MNGTLPRPDLHLPLPNSETDPDSWSCSRSRDTSPDSSIPPGMPSFRVIPLTCESEAGSADLLHDNQYVQRGSEPPVDHWEIEPLRSGSAQPPSTLLRKNQYWVRKFTFSQNSHFIQNSHFFQNRYDKGNRRRISICRQWEDNFNPETNHFLQSKRQLLTSTTSKCPITLITLKIQ